MVKTILNLFYRTKGICSDCSAADKSYNLY